MVVLLSFGFMFFIGCSLAAFGWGFANTIDRIAFGIHRFAVKTRRMQAKQEAINSDLWQTALRDEL